MSDIHIKISDVERLRSELERAEKAIDQALKSVDAALRSADWNDGNSRRFAEAWKTARARSSFASESDGLRRQLTTVINQAKAMGIR